MLSLENQKLPTQQGGIAVWPHADQYTALSYSKDYAQALYQLAHNAEKKLADTCGLSPSG